MTADKQKSLGPKLRFPDFRDTGRWKEMRLADVAPLQRGFDLPSTELEPGEVPVVYSNGIRNYHKFGMATGPGLVTGRSGTIGNLHYIEDGAYWPHNTSLWVTSFNGHHPKFVYFLYSAIGLDRFASGSGVPTLNRNDVHAFLTHVPPTEQEQGKIADCFGSLDDLIAAQDQKLEALRQHKQGLLQQLFPKPGETVPRLRFPEFREGPEWDLMLLSSASEVNPSNDGLPELFIYIDLESVKDSKLIERKEIIRDAAPSRAQRLLSRNDIIFQTVRPYQRNNLFFDIDDGCEYVASTGYAQLRAHESPEFLYQLLHTGSFVSSVLARCTGSNYPAISPSALASIEVVLPRKTEQVKIASCLGRLDNLVAAQAWKLEILRQHKRGLLQQLFPSPEVT